MNRRLNIVLNSILIFGLNQTIYAHDEPVLKLGKTRILADYQIQLICNTGEGVDEPQSCKISVYNPNEPDKSKATVILPNSEILIDSANKEQKQSSSFSSAALDSAEKSSELELQKYRISRDWLLRLEISESDKKPNFSIFSLFVPSEK